MAANANMDTAAFWAIMDAAYTSGGFNNEKRKQIILQRLTKFPPDQIREFEIIFQQMNLKANTWNNFAAQTIIEGGSSDDRFYYFRCWLISLGQKNYEETLKAPDYLAQLDIPTDPKTGYSDTEFEDLIPLSDNVYQIATGASGNDPDMPRNYALKKGLYFDTGGETKGKEWTSNEELPKIAPALYKKYNSH